MVRQVTGEPALRAPVLLRAAARDAAREARRRVVTSPPREADDSLELAIGYLCRTHDVTGRRGSSKGYSLVRGWMPAYPETSGYMIGTLLKHGERAGRPELADRALALGRWEVEIQEPDGGIMTGELGTTPRRSVVFNTGMVLHGWADLRAAGHTTFDEAGDRAARFLLEHMRDDGTWDPDVEYCNLPHTYNSRVAWAMLRWALMSGDDDLRAAARRQLDWVVDRQRPNGWFDDCVFKPRTTPSTHGIAYTLRGLLESYALVGEERWLSAALRTSEVLIRKQEVLGRLPANYDSEWQPTAPHVCLTGSVQLGGVWLRLATLSGDDRFLNAGLKAIDAAAAAQERSRTSPARGGLAGSLPVWGRYAPLQYPNWAAKFLADSLMLREDATGKLA